MIQKLTASHLVAEDILERDTFYALYTYEPPHDKTNKMTCAPGENLDQPGHPPV